MQKSRKGPRIYKTLLDKDLVTAQKREVALRFDLANESWLAETLVQRFYAAMDDNEAKHGVQRVKPGELLVCYEGQEITLPLLTPSWAAQLADDRRFLRHKTDVERAMLDVIKRVNPGSTLTDVHKLVNPRDLLPRWEAGGCERTRMPDTARLIDPHKVSAAPTRHPKPGEVPIPPAIRQQLGDFLTRDAGIGLSRANAMLDFLVFMVKWNWRF